MLLDLQPVCDDAQRLGWALGQKVLSGAEKQWVYSTVLEPSFRYVWITF